MQLDRELHYQVVDDMCYHGMTWNHIPVLMRIKLMEAEIAYANIARP